MRVAVVRAVTAGALDRAVDVAATLELRGYATRRRGARPQRAPWSRHDTSVLAAALVLLIHALRVGLSGDLRGMAQLISTRSAEEEVEEEIRDLKNRQVGGGI